MWNQKAPSSATNPSAFLAAIASQQSQTSTNWSSQPGHEHSFSNSCSCGWQVAKAKISHELPFWFLSTVQNWNSRCRPWSTDLNTLLKCSSRSVLFGLQSQCQRMSFTVQAGVHAVLHPPDSLWWSFFALQLQEPNETSYFLTPDWFSLSLLMEAN